MSEPDPPATPDQGDVTAPERRDADGLPLDREPTLDDVRGSAGSGRTIAVGCFVLVVLAVIGFWLVRGGLLG